MEDKYCKYSAYVWSQNLELNIFQPVDKEDLANILPEDNAQKISLVLRIIGSWNSEEIPN